MTNTILPGATLGVLGSGQLGRMFAIAARRLGYRVHVLSPDNDTPTGQVADVEIRADYEDADAVARMARGVDVVTFEFENVPQLAADTAAQFAPVRPGGGVLHTTQNRAREKSFLGRIGVPVAPFAVVQSKAELKQAAGRIGYPGVLKTADWGYDGKGQLRINSAETVEALPAADCAREHVLEALIDFECELSVVVARGLHGQRAAYGPIVNTHRNHILDTSIMPASVGPKIAAEALAIADEVSCQLDAVGVLCVEFFLTRDGQLLVNEIAPRPHNSGHLTIDACATCQFEQQVRAICGLPLGSTEQHRPAAMANLLGDLWSDGPPAWDRALAYPDVKLHLYGKSAARAGRKMGHVTALAETAQLASLRVAAARQSLEDAAEAAARATTSTQRADSGPATSEDPSTISS